MAEEAFTMSEAGALWLEVVRDLVAHGLKQHEAAERLGLGVRQTKWPVRRR